MGQTADAPLWKQAFPEFETLGVEIPQGFEDASWRNDACPSFMSSELDAHLYVDHADPAKREVEGAKRFVLLETVDGQYASSDNTLAVSDDFDEILTAIDERRAARAPKVG